MSLALPLNNLKPSTRMTEEARRELVRRISQRFIGFKHPSLPENVDLPDLVEKILDALIDAVNGDGGNIVAGITTGLGVISGFLGGRGLKLALSWVLEAVQDLAEPTNAPPAKRLTKADIKAAGYVLPILYNPADDEGLPIIAAFVNAPAKSETIEVAYIWRNEIMPYHEAADLAYAIVRALPPETTNASWGRVQDVEHVRINYTDESRQTVSSITFYSYSDGSRWNGISPEETTTIRRNKLTFDGDRPIIYVNTWNHCIGESNTSQRKSQPAPQTLVLESYSDQGLDARESADLWIRNPDAGYAPALTFTSLRKTDLPGRSGPTNVLVHGNQLFAGCDGYAYELDPDGTKPLATNGLPGTGDHEVRLAAVGDTLYAAIHGQVRALDIQNGLKELHRYDLPDRSGKTDILVMGEEGRVFAACDGTVYELDPGSNDVLVRKDLPKGKRGETRLSAYGKKLYAAVDGWAFALDTRRSPDDPICSLAAQQLYELKGVNGLTSVLACPSGLFAAAEGAVFQFDPYSGDLLRSATLPGGGQEVRLTVASEDLFAGCNGRVFVLDLHIDGQLNPKLPIKRTYTLAQRTGPVDVLVKGGLFAGANCWAYDLDTAVTAIDGEAELKGSGKAGPTRLCVLGDTLYAGIGGWVHAIGLDS